MKIQLILLQVGKNFQDFVNLKCNLTKQMPVFDELYLSRIFYHNIYMNINFFVLVFYNAFMDRQIFLVCTLSITLARAASHIQLSWYLVEYGVTERYIPTHSILNFDRSGCLQRRKKKSLQNIRAFQEEIFSHMVLHMQKFVTHAVDVQNTHYSFGQ